MKTFKNIISLQSEIKKIKLKNQTIGFVPTMGALHEGHLSLIRKARRENDKVVLSIFVNPKQFGKNEDFTKYPRAEKKDKILAQKEKVDIIFYPSEEKMYPTSYLTYVNVKKLEDILCGKSRPGHFEGVATIVCKLLNIVTPDILYLGQKDAQQAIIIKKMISDLNMQIRVCICPIIREKDGLAMSSRNAYLTEKQRQEATILYSTLKKAKHDIKNGERNPSKIINMIKKNIVKNSSGKIDYVDCREAATLKKFPNKIHGKILINLAVKFGKTRLIDNILLHLR